MDAVDCQESTKKPPRLRYERDTILAIKEHALVADLNLDDTLLRVNTVAQRGGRGKSKCSQSKSLSDRSGEAGGIVLGPQKRTWNTGCHVSYPAARDSKDIGYSRGGKLSSDYRSKDRQLGRPPNEGKHEFRGTGRERGGIRRNDGQFSRGRFRDERYGGHRSGYSEEEPEWFSEGPTTVNETIELGRVIEDDDGDSSFRHKLAPQPETPVIEADKERKTIPRTQPTDNTQSQPNLTRSAQSQPPVTVQPVSNGETQGSRFRYLFPKSDTVGDKKTSSLNDQLLELLKGSPGPSVSSPEKHNGILLRTESNMPSVLQVENKLRSLLLGHSLSRTADQSQTKSGLNDAVKSNVNRASEPKPKILTVEEIEAQLNLSTNPQPPSSLPVTDSQHLETEKRPFELPQPQSHTHLPSATTVPATCTSNLAPILHSLAVRQQQQQAMSTKQLHLHNPLGPFGILSNPMVRLPSTTNAMSASARINQLQHSDLPASMGVSDSTTQGNFLHPWDTQGNVSTNTSRTLPQPSAMNSVLQSCIGAPPGLSDFNCKSPNSVNPHTGPNINAMTAPRRPIVKAQQTTGSHGAPLSQMGFNNPSDSSSFGGYTRDMDRRFFNLQLKSQLQTPSDALNSGDKPQLAHLFSTTCGEFCFPPPSAPHLGQPMNPIVASNNNSNAGSIYLPGKLRATRPQSENSFAFLSQLVDLDRSNMSPLSYPKTSSAFNHLFTSGVKAKTLEEIEH